jgi:hypothetical protein
MYHTLYDLLTPKQQDMLVILHHKSPAVVSINDLAEHLYPDHTVRIQLVSDDFSRIRKVMAEHFSIVIAKGARRPGKRGTYHFTEQNKYDIGDLLKA